MFKRSFTSILVFFLITIYFLGILNLITEDAGGTDVEGGHLTVDTTWTFANSPYFIKGDVIVDLGVNLTIEPGVLVKFKGDYSLYIEGNLIALGSSANHISFTSDTGNPPQRGDWESIRVNATGRLEMNYCDLTYGDNPLYFYGTSNNVIENSTISESRRHGVYVRYSSYIKICNSDIGPNNWNGIYLLESTNTEISGCTIHSNSFEGISIYDSSYVAIDNTDSYSNEVDGIHLYSSSNITIKNSRVYQNGNNGVGLKLTENTILENCDIYSNIEDGIFLPDDSDGIIKDSTIYGHKNGIYLFNSSDFTLQNLDIYEYTETGISFLDSLYNSLDNIDIYSGGNFGILMSQDPIFKIGSSFNTLNDIDISGNLYGITIRFSHNNTLKNSYIHDNTNGFIAQQCEFINITSSNISNNEYYGISFIGSSNGEITYNDLYNNHYGIFLLAPSVYNLIHHNIIKEHTYYSYSANILNQWDDGFQGNYWGDYDGVDLGSDGIGDFPYPINPIGEDRYPLVDFYNTRFKILSSTPSNESINVSVSTNIILQLSESAIKETFEGNITIYPFMSILSYSWEDSDRRLTLTLAGDLTQGEFYTVIVKTNATGIIGRNLQYPFILNFYTENPSDVTPPHITEVFPTGTEVFTNTSFINISFSELMIKSSVETAFSIYPEIPGEFSWTNKTFSFHPRWELLDLTTYTITLNASIAKDVVGFTLDGNSNGLAEGTPIDDYSWSFTTTRYDIIPPIIKKVEPTGSMVDINSPIKIYFSELMNRTSVEDAFSYTNGSVEWTSANGTWGRSVYIMTFIPDEPFNYSQVYSLTLKSTAEDWHNNTLDGNANGIAEGSPVDDYTWSFKATYDPRFGLPTIGEVSPIGTDIAIDTEIIINFSQTMNQDSVKEAFSITDGISTWDGSSGAFIWEDNRTFFIPSFPLDYNKTYTVRINITATNIANTQLDGNENGIPEDYTIDAYSWNFATTAPIELILTDIQVNGDDASNPLITWYLGPGETAIITAKAKNTGYNTTGAPFILSFYNITGPLGGKNPYNESINYTIVPLVQGGDSGDRIWIWEVPFESGDYYMNITVDYGNDIPELDENNNTITLHLAVVPDLTITNITINGTPITAFSEGLILSPDEIITIGSSTTNIGQSSTGVLEFNMTFWESNETGVNFGNVLSDVGLLGPLDAGISTTMQYIQWQAPRTALAQDYYINISCDSNYLISETNEENNFFILHIRVDAPDLAPDFVELRIASSGSVLDSYADPVGIDLISSIIYLPMSEDLAITFDCINLGGVNQSLGTNVTVYNTSGLGGAPLNDPFFETSLELINLTAFGLENDQTSEAGQTVYFSWLNPNVAGMYYINISLDPGNKINELNESNNIFVLAINVSILPVTTVNAIGAVYYGVEWYINNLTQVNLTPISGTPPIYTWYRILDHDSEIVLQDWRNNTGNTSFILTFGQGSFRIEFYSIDPIFSEETKSKIVVVDTTPPNTTINIGVPNFKASGTDVLNVSSKTPISFDAMDYPSGRNVDDSSNASGLYSPSKPESGIFYGIWSVVLDDYISSFQKYMPGTSIYLSNDSWTDGFYEIHYNATDNLGNNESMKIFSVYLDNTSPATYIEVGAPNWTFGVGQIVNISSLTQFSLLALEDNGSGLKSTLYRIYDEDNSVYLMDWTIGTSFTISPSLSDGNYTIEFFSMDNVLNSHTTGLFNIYLDNSKPISSMSLGNPKYRLRETDYWMVAKNTSFSLQGEDGFGSGLKGTYYSIWNDSGDLVVSSNLYSQPFNLSGLGGDGQYTFRFWTIDNLNNTEFWNEIKVVLDGTLPFVLFTAPIGSGNSVNSYIQIIFSEKMDHDSVESAFSYTDGIQIWDYRHGFFNWNGRIMTFYPYENLSNGAFFTVIINTNASDNVGNRLDGNGNGIFDGDDDFYTWNFWTIEKRDIETPFVVNVFPLENAQNVPINEEIEIEFSEAMDELSVEMAFRYWDGERTYSSYDGVFTWIGNRTIFRPYETFNYDTDYTVTILGIARDISGNTLTENYTWNFKTQGDDLSPEVLYYSPAGDGVLIDTVISITFDEPMNKTSSEEALIIIPFINGTFLWNENTLLFTPVSALEYNTTYYIYVGIEAKDIVGNSLEFPYQFNFTTEPDTYPPEVIGHFPTGSEILLNSTITITFNEAMEHDSVESAFFIQPSAAGSFTWVGNTLIFTPIDLINETTYTITMGQEAKDISGNALLSPYQFSFTTKKDPYPPFVLEVEPTGDDVPVDSVIRIRFNEAMNLTSLYGAFKIEPYIPGTLSWEGEVLVFRPNGRYAKNTLYNVTILGDARDEAGNSMLTNYSWEFETEKTEPSTGAPIAWDVLSFVLLAVIITIILALILYIYFFKRRKEEDEEIGEDLGSEEEEPQTDIEENLVEDEKAETKDDVEDKDLEQIIEDLEKDMGIDSEEDVE
ncbi:MAG: Ig-like domain-containing protein [Thermoplasmata archaeon]|nr:MAG: Ig-like domain-containing protein [Thermoplasmata archaeon]